VRALFCFSRPIAEKTLSSCFLVRRASVPLTKEHLEALNAFVFHRVAVEEVGLVPAALEWVKLEVQLGTAQKRYGVLRRWLDDRESAHLTTMLAREGWPVL
jgi:hypothetical protein